MKMSILMLPNPVLSLILNSLHDWRLRSVCRKFKKCYLHCFNRRDYKKICKKGPMSVFTMYYDQFSDHDNEKLFKAALSGGQIEIARKLPIYNKYEGAKIACRYGNYELANEMMYIVDNEIMNEIAKGGNYKLFQLCQSQWEYNAGAIMGFAAEYGRDKIVSFLLEKDASLCAQGLLGACRGGQFELVEFLVEKGADNFDDAIVYALAGRGDLKLINYLMTKGAKLEDCIQAALSSGNPEFVDFVLKNEFVIGGVTSWPKNLREIINICDTYGCQLEFSRALEKSDDVMLMARYFNYVRDIRVVENRAIKIGNIKMLEFLVTKGSQWSQIYEKANYEGSYDVATYAAKFLGEKNTFLC